MEARKKDPYLSVTSVNLKKKRHLRIHVSPASNVPPCWEKFPSLLEDAFRNPTVKELRELPQVREFLKKHPPDSDFIVVADCDGDKPKELQVRFLDGNDNVRAIARWHHKEGFSFRELEPGETLTLH
jgi:hypothetical protein